MEKMTLSRALRYKKRVIEKIRKFESDVQENNSKVEGEARDVDPALSIQLRESWVKHLIDLKLKIQEATRPIQKLVLELAETKAEISFYRGISTVHRMHRPRYRDEAAVKYEAIIRKPEVDSAVTTLQDKIDDLLKNENRNTPEITVRIASIFPISVLGT